MLNIWFLHVLFFCFFANNKVISFNAVKGYKVYKGITTAAAIRWNIAPLGWQVQKAPAMIQLQAVETADTELEWQDSGREKVVEQNFRSILRVHLDDVEKYGLEHCALANGDEEEQEGKEDRVRITIVMMVMAMVIASDSRPNILRSVAYRGLYFQALRTFCQVYFLISFLSIFQMMFALEGTRFADNDFFSTLATLTMGNTDESTALSAGTLHFRLSSGADSISFLVNLKGKSLQKIE